MTNPTETIGRGLDAIERAKKTPGTFRLSALASAPSNIAAIHEITIKASKARDHLHKMRAASVIAVEKHRAKITANLAELSVAEDDSGRIVTLDANRRRKMIEESVEKFRNMLNAETAEERAKLLAEQREAKATLDLVRRSWTLPVDSLMTSTLGSEQRAICTRNLERAGPTELENAIREAVTTGNRDLAAACLVRLDSIGKESRKLVQYSKSEVAEQMAGEGFTKAQEAFALADLAIAQSDLADQEIGGKAATAGQKIKVGVMRHELEIKFGRKLDADGHAIDADGNRENENLEQRLDRLYPGGPLPEGYTLINADGSEANADGE